MLAEREAPSLFDRNSPIAWIACQASTAVDDLLIGFADGGVAYLQLKRSVSLSPRPASGEEVPLGSAFDQFVRQYHAGVESHGAPRRDWDLARDRMVLGVGTGTFNPVKRVLAGLLHRLRPLPEGQPLDAAVTNEPEKGALKIVLDHVRPAWRAAVQRDPTDAELLEFLRFIWVHEFAVEPGEAGETTAEHMLRTSVLRDSGQSPKAWKVIRSDAQEMVSNRRSVDRSGAERELAKHFPLKGAPSYHDDFRRLSEHTRRGVDRLADFARIELAGRDVHVERAHVPVVRAAAEDGPLLVVGRPGAGKSGVQHGFVVQAQAERRDLVFLAAQDHTAGSLAGLRAELFLEHDIVEVLANWPGPAPAFLVVDALDAARGEPAARALRDLIREVGLRAPRWHVVASVREFELRYGQDLRRLFRGAPPANAPEPPLPDPSLRRVRHIVVGDLSAADFRQVAAAAPELHQLVEGAPPALRGLLANPFNLNLAAALLDSGRDPEEIRGIKTQMDLLDSYWTARVLETGRPVLRTARIDVVRRAAREMIRLRSLRAPHSQVAGAAESEALHELLGAHVLSEGEQGPEQAPDDTVLAFGHHRIFDFAVERVLLRGTPVADRLAADPQFGLFARPSLEMHFEHLWDAAGPGRAEFWAEVLDVCGRAGLRAVDVLVGPGVAATRARTLDDVSPLVEGLESANPASRMSAEQALSHTLRTLLPGAVAGVPLLGPEAGPWTELLERTSRRITPPVANTLRAMLNAAVDHRAAATDAQRADLSTASRRLLEFAWELEPRPGFLVRAGIEAVLTFYTAAPAESAALVRRGLTAEHVARYGHEELRYYGDHVRRLATVDAELVRDLYSVAFSTEPPEKVRTGWGGNIMSFSSDAAQDFGSSLYVLARAFPGFAMAAPEHATAALSQVAEFHGRHARINRPPEEGTFEFHGETARFRADYQGLWRDRRNADEAKKLFGCLAARLARLAGEDGGLAVFRRIVAMLVRENRTASLWKVLLEVGARAPDVLGQELKPLLVAPVLLGGVDTRTAAAGFVAAMAPHLPEEERVGVERAILSVEEPDLSALGLANGRVRVALLARLGWDPVTEEARRLLEEWNGGGAAAPELDEGLTIHYHTVAASEDERLEREGVAIDLESNRRLRELAASAAAVSAALEGPFDISRAAVERGPAALAVLADALGAAEAGGAHPVVVDEARTSFLTLSADLAEAATHPCSSATGRLLRDTLLEAARDPRPEPEPESEAEFTDWPILLSGQPRGLAAAGLTALCRDPSCATPEVLEALERLAADPVARVRVRVARGLDSLAASSPEVAWKLADAFARNDPSAAVVHAAVDSLGAIGAADPGRAAGLAIAAHQRLAEHADAPNARWKCIEVLRRLYLLQDEPAARDYLLGIADHPSRFADEAQHLLGAAQATTLTQGPVEAQPSRVDTVRRRCLDLFGRLTRATADEFELRVREDGPEDEDPDARRTRAQSLAELLDGAGRTLYYAAGADRGSGQRPSNEVRERLYQEAGQIIDTLAGVGLASLAHHLVETLEVFIPADPPGVFLRVAAVVRAGERGGYAHEPLAEEVIVRIVTTYFADHPDVFQRDEDCRTALLDVLDAFVRAGWVSAQRITYGLGEVFR